MSADEHKSDEVVPARGGRFASTRWSLILTAGDRGGDEAAKRQALQTLCEAYWFPLYCFARRTLSAEQSQDMTQAFFAEILEKNVFSQAAPDRGLFRSFLLTAFKNFLAKQRERDRALKRGGGVRLLSIDFSTAESGYSLQPATELTAEQEFDRRWALAAIDRSMEQLRVEFHSLGKTDLFEQLKPFLVADPEATSYGEIAAASGMTVGSLKMATHRMRARFRELLRGEIAETVGTPAAIEEEIGWLMAALRRPRGQIRG